MAPGSGSDEEGDRGPRPRDTITAIGGIAWLLVSLCVALLLIALAPLAVQAPDPFIASGDPCFGHPDGWSDVISGLVTLVIAAAIDAVMLLGAIGLIRSAHGLRPLRRNTWLLAPAITAAAMAVLLAAMIAPKLDEGRTPPDCDGFTVRPGEWKKDGSDASLRLAHGLAHCRLLHGKTPAQVARLTGRPYPTQQGVVTHDGAPATYWSFDGLTIFFRNGRVTDARAGYE